MIFPWRVQSITNDARAERKEPINASRTTRNGLESRDRGWKLLLSQDAHYTVGKNSLFLQLEKIALLGFEPSTMKILVRVVLPRSISW